MKNCCNNLKSLVLLFVILSAVLLTSCKNSSSPVEPEEKEFSEATIAALDAAIDKAMSENFIPGVIVGVWFPNEGTYIRAKGVSNLVTNEPMKIENHFRIGSVTKTFTGTAVLKLVEEGKINLDSSLAYYLPEYPFPEANKITIRMLGNMTSGLIDYTRVESFIIPLFQNNFEETFTADSLVKVALTKPPMFEPGQGWSYSNTNTVLLGLICEKVTGQKIQDIFNEKIFKPYGLTNTIWPLTRFLPEPYSHGYTTQTWSGLMEDATYYDPSWGDAAGILISNIYDLKKWANLLGTGSMYGSNMQMERLKWVDTGIQGRNYGFAIGGFNGWLGHSGEIFGYNTCVDYFPAKDAVIIINVNSDIPSTLGNPATEVFNAIARVLTPNNIPYN